MIQESLDVDLVVVEEELVVLVSLQEVEEQQVQMVLVEDLNLMERQEVQEV